MGTASPRVLRTKYWHGYDPVYCQPKGTAYKVLAGLGASLALLIMRESIEILDNYVVYTYDTYDYRITTLQVPAQEEARGKLSFANNEREY